MYRSLTCRLAGIVAFVTTVTGSQLIAQPPSRAPQLVVDAEGFTSPVQSLAISDDGKWLAAAAEKVVRIWNLTDNSLHATLRGYQEPYGYHVGYIDSMTFSPDSRFLLVGVSDNYEEGSTRVYDLSNPNELKQLIKGHLGCTRGVVFSDDGGMLATWGCDGNIILYDWNRLNGKAEEKFRVNWMWGLAVESVPFRVFQFIENDRFLWFRQQSRDGVVDLATQSLIPTQNSAQQPMLSSLSEMMQSMRHAGTEAPNYLNPWFVVPHGRNLQRTPWIVAGANERAVGSRNFWVAGWLLSGEIHVLHEHRYRIVSTVWNPKNQLAASADLLGEIHVWHAADNSVPSRIFSAANQQIWNVQWGSNGDALQFATINLPRGEFHFNNYGGITNTLDLKNLLLLPGGGVRKIRPTSLKRRTPLGMAEFLRPGGNRSADLMIKVAGLEYPLNPSLEPDTDQRKQRFEQLGNLAVRTGQSFGEISFFSAFQYPKANRPDLILLGTETGKLCEGYPERVGDRLEFRVTRNFLGHSSKITGAEVSPDGQYLASSSLDGTIRIWPLSATRQLGDFDFLADGSSIDYIPENGESARGGLRKGDVLQYVGNTTYYERIPEIQKGLFRMGDIVPVTVSRRDDSGIPRRLTLYVRLSATPDITEPLLSFFLSRDGEWIVWNQSGHYDSSHGGARYVGWHINSARHEPADFFAGEQFQKHLYQPAVVRETLRLGDPEKAVSAVNARFPETPPLAKILPVADEISFARYRPPEISIVTPASNSRVEGGLVSIKALVRLQAGNEFRDARLFIDEKPFPGSLQPIVRESSGDEGEYWIDVEVKLTPGRHSLRLLVTSSGDTTESKTVSVVVRDPASEKETEPNAPRGRLFLLAIGISTYANPQMSLSFAAADAAAFAELWNHGTEDAFSEVVSRVLLNDQATVQGIKEDGLAWLLEQSLTADDTVIVFLSGHGHFDKFDEWFFGGHELDLNRLITTGISDAELSSFFSKLPSGTILFTDSCYAGAFQLPPQVRRNSRSGKNIWRGTGKIAFSSCLPDEISLEAAQWKHGAFTRAVLDYFTLDDADLNKDGLLSCIEMHLYVQSRVRELTGGRQNPTAEIPSGVSDVIFGKAGRSHN